MVKLVTIRTYFKSRNHWRSSVLNCLRVQFTASAAAGLKPSSGPSVEQYSSGGGVEAIQRPVGGTILVVVSLDDGDVHLADDFEAFLGVGVIADDIAQAGEMGALLLFDVLQNDRERL